MKLLSILVLAATAGAALAQDAPTAEDLVLAIEENGCSMKDGDAALLLTPLGFTEENTPPLVEELIADGIATVKDDVLTVKTEACP